MTISVDGPTFMGEPLWLHIHHAPVGVETTYPRHSSLERFEPFEVEVEQNGRIVEPRPLEEPGCLSALSGCFNDHVRAEYTTSARLPLAARYSLTTPGRYTVRLKVSAEQGLEVTARTEFELRAAPPAKRDLVFKTPAPATEGFELTDSILRLVAASPDPRAIRPMLELANSRRDINRLATESLRFFSLPEVASAVVELAKRRGLNDELATFVVEHEDAFAAQASELITASIDHLAPVDEHVSLGSISLLAHFREARSLGPAGRARADDAVLAMGPQLLAASDDTLHAALASYLGSTKSDRARALLTQMSSTLRSNEIPTAHLALIGDVRDLPFLSQRTPTPFLVESMAKGFGSNAGPYFEKCLADAVTPQVHLECAKALAAQGHRAGFRALVKVLGGTSPARLSALMWLRSSFGPTHALNGDEGRITAYLKAKPNEPCSRRPGAGVTPPPAAVG